MQTTSNIKLSIVVPSISRSGGGFFHSVRNLSKHLHSTDGIELKVLTSENDCPIEDLDAWRPVQPIHCSSYGPYSFRYSPSLSAKLDSTEASLVHLHGIWQHPSLVTNRWRKKWNKPTLISPRGMLDPWAIKRSSFKKKIVEHWFERSNLEGASCIHSLCAAESLAIREYGLKQPICEIANGVELPLYPHFDSRGSRKTRNLLFLSRIHPKKGILELVQGWIDWKSKNPSSNDWRLLIVGWNEIGFLDTLLSECDRAGLAYENFEDSTLAVKALSDGTPNLGSVWFVGGAFGKTKDKLFTSSDAFILPSHSEGLPISVLEAWSYGLPALISPQCNLPIGYDTGIAFPIENSRESISQSLDLFFSIPIDRQLEIGKAARSLVEKRYTWQIISGQMVEVYRWLTDEAASKPSSIHVL